MTERFDLRTARVNAGLSQRELAELVGVPFKSVQRLEAGEGTRPRNAKRVADYFGVLATDLLPVEREAA